MSQATLIVTEDAAELASGIGTQVPHMEVGTMTPGITPGRQEHLSYKFQRLRERIRHAVASGELAGKLPGERELAKRFKANPKTLSKALTDLAAEGLLDRSIGRGTYVRGSTPAEEQLAGKWMLIVPEEMSEEESAIAAQLAQRHRDTETVKLGAEMRPSFVSQFSGVIDLTGRLPDSFRRGLLVRGIGIVSVGSEPAGLKTSAVLLDKPHAAACLARALLLGGHRRIVVVEQPQDNSVSQSVRQATDRYAPGAAVQPCDVAELSSLMPADGSLAIICDGTATARQVRKLADEHSDIAAASLVALGCCCGEPPCTGVYADPAELAETAGDLLRTCAAHRPTVLWLTGRYTDRGTARPVAEAASPTSQVTGEQPTLLQA
jgi:DNA-binding transcriptional regulator YhcF (GntR family)